MVQVTVSLAHPLSRRGWKDITVMVDTGALFSVVPAAVLTQLGLSPVRTETFELADGRTIRRPIGEVFLRLDGKEATIPVIFGETSDSPLLGVTALEIVGLTVDPQGERLVPRKMYLL